MTVGEDLLAGPIPTNGIVEELQILVQIPLQHTPRVGVQPYNLDQHKLLIEPTGIGDTPLRRVHLEGIHSVDVPSRLSWMRNVDGVDSCGIDRRCGPMEVLRELHVLEEPFCRGHVQLTSFCTRLSTVDEELGGEGSFSVGCVVAEAEHGKVGIVEDGLLDAVVSKFACNGLVEEAASVDLAEHLELWGRGHQVSESGKF